MLYATLKALHLLAVIVWVGGMVFAHFFLRPSLGVLEPAQRLKLMHAVLGRFFNAVLGAIAIVLGSGLWMIGRTAKATFHAGGSFAMPLDWTLMAGGGLLMIAIFGHIRFVLHKRLSRAVAAGDVPRGAAVLASIRAWVSVNLALGVGIVVTTLLL